MKAHSLIFTLTLALSVVHFSPSALFSAETIVADVQLEPVKSNTPVLTIESTKGSEVYSLPRIESIGLKQLRTSTFWPEDDGVYEGVLLLDLLLDSGMQKCNSIEVSALDDYHVKIPCEDIQKWPVLLATRRDGKPMSIRQKGPTRIIYPKDLGGAVASSDMRSRWIWAIKTISIKD